MIYFSVIGVQMCVMGDFPHELNSTYQSGFGKGLHLKVSMVNTFGVGVILLFTEVMDLVFILFILIWSSKNIILHTHF